MIKAIILVDNNTNWELISVNEIIFFFTFKKLTKIFLELNENIII